MKAARQTLAGISAPGGPRLACVVLGLAVFLLSAFAARTQVVAINDKGKGADYMTGDPIVLPAAFLSTNRFELGAVVIRDRPHCVRPAVFDSSKRLSAGEGVISTNSSTGFPSYLKGAQYLTFLQNVRHYTNYSCTVTVDRPATFYLLVDNRVNLFGDEKYCSDPVFGEPDTQWILDDKWERVNTGLSPNGSGDYLAIDEGANGTVNNYYSIYCKRLDKPGSITLRTQFEGNIYCLAVSASAPPVLMAGREKSDRTNVPE